MLLLGVSGDVLAKVEKKMIESPDVFGILLFICREYVMYATDIGLDGTSKLIFWQRCWEIWVSLANCFC